MLAIITERYYIKYIIDRISKAFKLFDLFLKIVKNQKELVFCLLIIIYSCIAQDDKNHVLLIRNILGHVLEINRSQKYLKEYWKFYFHFTNCSFIRQTFRQLIVPIVLYLMISLMLLVSDI